MGYSTEFKGQFDLRNPLEPKHRKYLKEFSDTRRMKRNRADVVNLTDFSRTAVNFLVGENGQYYVGGTDDGVIDRNIPPPGQPHVWCDWKPNMEGTAIMWNGAENTYHYGLWLEYIINHFLRAWRYELDGTVTWQGDYLDDFGTIIVYNNTVSMHKGEYKQPMCNKEIR